MVLAFSLRVQALTIIPTYGSSIANDPKAATIEATINAAIAVFESSFSDPITVTIEFYEMNDGLGKSSPWYWYGLSYSDYRAALVAHATTADDTTALAHLPNTTANPVDENENICVSFPLARALGFELEPPPGDVDSTIGLHISIMNLSAAETDSHKYSLFAVVSHEIDEVLGFSSALNGSNNGDPLPPGPACAEDLFRYDQYGNRSYTTALNAAAYLSIDGTTDLARFDQEQPASGHLDFQDWYSPGGQTPQVQDARGTPGATPELGVELVVLDVIGYNRGRGSIWVAFGGSDQGNGTYSRPYNTLARGTTGVPAGGTILIKAPSSTPETMTIAKAMTIRVVGGSATIGR